MKIYQFIENYMDEFTYLIVCEESLSAVAIDPAGDMDEIIKFINENNYKIDYILNTHHHADHTSGVMELKKATNAKVAIHENEIDYLYSDIIKNKFLNIYNENPPVVDILFDGDEDFNFGKLSLKIINTPGHTAGGVCFLCNGNLFTGDVLFVGAVGRTDLPGGDSAALAQSIKTIFKTLPDETVIWPGHDYGKSRKTTVLIERNNNQRVKEYIKS